MNNFTQISGRGTGRKRALATLPSSDNGRGSRGDHARLALKDQFCVKRTIFLIITFLEDSFETRLHYVSPFSQVYLDERNTLATLLSKVASVLSFVHNPSRTIDVTRLDWAVSTVKQHVWDVFQEMDGIWIHGQLVPIDLVQVLFQ